MKRNPINGNEKYNEGHKAENKKILQRFIFYVLYFIPYNCFYKVIG